MAQSNYTDECLQRVRLVCIADHCIHNSVYINGSDNSNEDSFYCNLKRLAISADGSCAAKVIVQEQTVPDAAPAA